jgi:uncharacterized phage infection (PIP) family protein YhgE
MEIKNKLKVVIISSVIGVFYSIYLLYNKRGGYMATNDWLSILVVIAFLIGLIIYFKKKWEREQE